MIENIGYTVMLTVGATVWLYILVKLLRYAWLSAGRNFRNDPNNEDE